MPHKRKQLGIIELDPYLLPYESKLRERLKRYERLKKRLTGGAALKDFANGSLYYGFHREEGGWRYREWAPAADALSLVGDFNGWDGSQHPLTRLENGNWELFLPDKDALTHGSRVKVRVSAGGRTFDKIPLYMKRVVQNADLSFCGQVWEPEPFVWSDHEFNVGAVSPLLIYECHIGMAGEKGGVSTYAEFAQAVLPRVKRAGYNAVQIMAIMEHPYYASFGYQVTNFFAVSSRFGTPEELKALINTAHSMGIAVLLDIIHSHASKNELEGINGFDGTQYQFFHTGGKGEHSAWGTKLFNYSKPEVLHFLLSNVKFYLEEYHFDGFRFDGVTSMLYHHHGLGVAFDNYDKYFMATDDDALAYLQLASELTKQVKPGAVLISEDMSGMPGMCVPVSEGGVGFDYRLAMGVPDFWIRTLKTLPDEKWNLWGMWHELTTRRSGEKNVGYCESHDQALVGDKTIMFWLADKEMYWHMDCASKSDAIDRAIALHKLIRLISFSLSGEAYLNFMGNEFGHPEWVDFPREGNGWSYHHARRQWSLSDNEALRYRYLLDFDRHMLELSKRGELLALGNVRQIFIDQERLRMAYARGDYYFAFNFHPTKEQSVDFDAGEGVYDCVLDTDAGIFGGSCANAMSEAALAKKGDSGYYIGSVLPKRSAKVFKKRSGV